MTHSNILDDAHQKVAIAHSIGNPKIPIPAEESHALIDPPWNSVCRVIRQIWGV